MEVYWLEQSLDNVPAHNDWLGAGELLRLRVLRFAKRRDDWRLGRWTAKQALSLYWGLPPHSRVLAKIEISSAPSGAPEVYFRNVPAPIAISLSHRSGKALCCVAVAGAELGCDLELIEQRSDGFIADYFTEDEQQTVFRADVADQPRVTSLLWSAKESALKALRTGLRLETTSVSVRLAQPFYDANGWSPLEVYHDGRIFHGWAQQRENMVSTIVADPVPHVPIALRFPSKGARESCFIAEGAHVLDRAV